MSVIYYTPLPSLYAHNACLTSNFLAVLVLVFLLCQLVPSRFRRIEVVLPSLNVYHWSATLADMIVSVLVNFRTVSKHIEP